MRASLKNTYQKRAKLREKYMQFQSREWESTAKMARFGQFGQFRQRGELGAPIQTDRNERRLVNRRLAGIRKITNGRKKAVGGTKRTTTVHPPFNGRERPLTG
jgi:hypothetical protein